MLEKGKHETRYFAPAAGVWKKRKDVEAIRQMNQGPSSVPALLWVIHELNTLNRGSIFNTHERLTFSPSPPALAHLWSSVNNHFSASSGVIQRWRRKKSGPAGRAMRQAGGKRSWIMDGNGEAMLNVNMNGLPCSHLLWSPIILRPRRCAVNFNSLFVLAGHPPLSVMPL